MTSSEKKISGPWRVRRGDKGKGVDGYGFQRGRSGRFGHVHFVLWTGREDTNKALVEVLNLLEHAVLDVHGTCYSDRMQDVAKAFGGLRKSLEVR